MHQIVRTRIERNAEYHEALVEYYSDLQQKSAAEAPPAEAPPAGGRRRAEPLPGTPPEAEAAAMPVPLPGPSADDLATLVEMHSGAAKDLRDLLAGEPVQQILSARSRPPITRQSGPTSMRVH